MAPAEYEMEMDGAKIQPLLVDVEHLSGNPKLSVKLDGIDVFLRSWTRHVMYLKYLCLL